MTEGDDHGDKGTWKRLKEFNEVYTAEKETYVTNIAAYTVSEDAYTLAKVEDASNRKEYDAQELNVTSETGLKDKTLYAGNRPIQTTTDTVYYLVLKDGSKISEITTWTGYKNAPAAAELGEKAVAYAVTLPGDTKNYDVAQIVVFETEAANTHSLHFVYDSKAGRDAQAYTIGYIAKDETYGDVAADQIVVFETEAANTHSLHFVYDSKAGRDAQAYTIGYIAKDETYGDVAADLERNHILLQNINFYDIDSNGVATPINSDYADKNIYAGEVFTNADVDGRDYVKLAAEDNTSGDIDSNGVATPINSDYADKNIYAGEVFTNADVDGRDYVKLAAEDNTSGKEITFSTVDTPAFVVTEGKKTDYDVDTLDQDYKRDYVKLAAEDNTSGKEITFSTVDTPAFVVTEGKKTDYDVDTLDQDYKSGDKVIVVTGKKLSDVHYVINVSKSIDADKNVLTAVETLYNDIQRDANHQTPSDFAALKEKFENLDRTDLEKVSALKDEMVATDEMTVAEGKKVNEWATELTNLEKALRAVDSTAEWGKDTYSWSDEAVAAAKNIGHAEIAKLPADQLAGIQGGLNDTEGLKVWNKMVAAAQEVMDGAAADKTAADAAQQKIVEKLWKVSIETDMVKSSAESAFKAAITDAVKALVTDAKATVTVYSFGDLNVASLGNGGNITVTGVHVTIAYEGATASKNVALGTVTVPYTL